MTYVTQSNYTITVPPVGLPITLAQAKAYLRVTNTAEDDLITSLIEAATNVLEAYTGRTFVQTTFQGEFSDLECTKTEGYPLLTLMRSPWASTVSVQEYIDGAYTNLSTDLWELRQLSGYSRVLFASEYSQAAYTDLVPYRYRVEFVAGFDPVPEAIKTAIKVVVNYAYANRGDCAGDCG